MANYKSPLSSDHLLRREAGEGWLSAKPDPLLLAAIVVREQYVDELAGVGAFHTEARVRDRYLDQCRRVGELKTELGITDPPPLSPEG